MAAACSEVWPRTDIVMTSGEDVGRYEVNATVRGDELLATVCVSQPREADEIAARVARQLYNHSYGAMRLDLVSAVDGSNVARYSFTPAAGLTQGAGDRLASQPAPSPRCGDRAPSPQIPAAVVSPGR